MAEELIISTSTDKQERYTTLIPQIQSLIEGEPRAVPGTDRMHTHTIW